MAKVLTAMIGFLGMITMPAPIINNSIMNMNTNNFCFQVKDWPIKPYTVTEERGPNQALNFIASVIDLGSLNINDLCFTRNYKEVLIEDFAVSFNGKLAEFNSASWNVRQMALRGSEKQFDLFTEDDGQTKISLERRYWLYNSVVNHHLMLRLTYNASMVVHDTDGDKGGEITFTRGSNIHIS